MGEQFDYVCPECEHKATVNGGKDRGIFTVYQTKVCKTCIDVVDVLIGFNRREGPCGNPKYDKDLNKCPECNGTDLKRWYGSQCPKCKCEEKMWKYPNAKIIFD